MCWTQILLILYVKVCVLTAYVLNAEPSAVPAVAGSRPALSGPPHKLGSRHAQMVQAHLEKQAVACCDRHMHRHAVRCSAGQFRSHLPALWLLQFLSVFQIAALWHDYC